MYHDLATSTGVVCPEESIFLMNVYPESDQNYVVSEVKTENATQK